MFSVKPVHRKSGLCGEVVTSGGSTVLKQDLVGHTCACIQSV